MPRFRFSLRSFFLFLLFACLIGSNIFTAREVNRLNEKLSEALGENDKLKAELGLLVVTDPNKLHAVAVQTHEAMTWRWRLFVPKGRTNGLFVAMQDIPKNGLPTKFNLVPLSEGEYSLTVALRRGHLEKWHIEVIFPSGAFPMAMPEDHSAWLGHYIESDMAWKRSVSTNPGEPMVLLRVRAMPKVEDGKSRTIPPDPCDGLMIWIAEPKR